jgi:threonine synthase
MAWRWRGFHRVSTSPNFKLTHYQRSGGFYEARSPTIWGPSGRACRPARRGIGCAAFAYKEVKIVPFRYISTRGAAPALSFDEVLLEGLAPDGGLYLPERWPTLGPGEFKSLRGLSYGEVAARVTAPYVEGCFDEAEFAAIVRKAYAGFSHSAVAPLCQLDSGLWLLELFHGPTLSFKDYALQLLGRLFERVLEKRGRRATILVATSGDTGSAAIEACRDRAALDIFVLHPKGRVSEVQRRQMTTVTGPNVHNLAVEGTFDDCQDLVKAMFADASLRRELNLSAMNSINWARIMAQAVYYVWAALALGAEDEGIAFAVPSGNFGNAYAGYVAAAMGLPIRRIAIGTNRNDILARFLATGVLEIRPVEPTISPAMDIQISSNLERLLFELLDRDGVAGAKLMEQFRRDGRVVVAEAVRRRAGELFEGFCLDDKGTIRSIAETYKATGMLLDPHGAIGVAAARAWSGQRVSGASLVPMVALACASPAKFPDAVQQASGVAPRLPARLANLFEREERVEVVKNDIAAVKEVVRMRATV